MPCDDSKISWKDPDGYVAVMAKKVKKTILGGVVSGAIAGAFVMAAVYHIVESRSPGTIPVDSWRMAVYAYAAVPAVFIVLAYIYPRIASAGEYTATSEGIHWGRILYKWENFQAFSISECPGAHGLKTISLYKRERLKGWLKDALRPKINDVTTYALEDEEKFHHLAGIAGAALPEVQPGEYDHLDVPVYYTPLIFLLWLGASMAAGYYTAGSPKGALLPVVILMILIGPGFIIGAVMLLHYKKQLQEYPLKERLQVVAFILVPFYHLVRTGFFRWRQISGLTEILNFSAAVIMMVFAMIFRAAG